MSEGSSSGAIRSVGVIGLGIMGSSMARNLLRAGFEVVVYNRTAERARSLVEAGARLAASPAGLAGAADAVLTMVSDDPALSAVLLGPDGAFEGCRPRQLFVDASTVTPEQSRAMAAEARRRGCDYLDAPVIGSKDAARDGQLFFLVGGEADAFERARPLFDATGRKAVHMGPSGSGSAMKLVNNMIAAVTMAAIAEGILAAEEAGLDPGRVRQVLWDATVSSPLLRMKLPKMQSRDFSTQFALALMRKDVRYFMQLTNRAGRPAPTAALVGELLQAAVQSGWGESDMSALFAYLRGDPAPAVSAPGAS